jgi:hypothetical protein
MFHRAVGSVATSGSLIDEELLSGHPVFIQVDYDSVVDGFEKTASGGRVRRQLGDHVAVGGTYVEDELGAGNYELQGLDAEIRMGRNSRIAAEYAESDGVDSVTFVSEDGGVTYTSVPTTGLEEGDAWKAIADLDVGEWFGNPDRYRLNLYRKELEPGFFSNGNFLEQGTEKTGAHASLKISGADTVALRHDREERTGVLAPGSVAETTITSAQWNRILERWGVGVEFLEKESEDSAGNLIRESRLGAARLWSKLSEKLLARLERQQTLSGPDNDQTTLDVEYQATRALSLTTSVTDGSLGSSAQAGAIVGVGDSRLYVTERVIDDRKGERTSTIIGARSPIGKDSRVYTEYQWEDAEEGRRRVSLMGLQRQWEVAPGVRFLLSGEAADVTGGATVSKRSAATASLTYSNARGLTALSRNQVRREEGAVRRNQILSFSKIDYRFSPDFSLLGRFRYSKTRDRDSDLVEARLDERSIGVAYRPTARSRPASRSST